jgi:DNA invertase Pin-like site-specific DNA recombinase
VEARPAGAPPARPYNNAGRPPARGVKFRSLTEAIDTATPTGRAMWQMVGVLAELERSLISERTRAEVKAAPGREVWTEGEAHARADRPRPEADRQRAKPAST